MDLINRERKVYGPPAELNAKEPEWTIAASYGPSEWVRRHVCTVRGVLVSKLSIREGEKHVWCLFPDGRTMIVAEANIHAIKHKRYGGSSDVKPAQSGTD